ncbi:hypothetical protein, partial [Salmonella enterica]|uniref:hypothetical protein n=1 Tax=Salmonella enterica TaxID=28901 RepID=UPI003CED1EA2
GVGLVGLHPVKCGVVRLDRWQLPDEGLPNGHEGGLPNGLCRMDSGESCRMGHAEWTRGRAAE